MERAGRFAAEQIGCTLHPLAPALERLAPPDADPSPTQAALEVGQGAAEGSGALCVSTRNLIVEIEALARADYFVGTTASAIPGVVEARSPYATVSLT